MTADRIEPSGESPPPEPEPEREPEEEEAAKAPAEPEWVDLLGSGAIMKQTLVEGAPHTRPQRLDRCTLNYELSLPDGLVVERQSHFSLHLGDCEVVHGLDIAIGLMNVGEKCLLKINPRLAFGHLGLHPHVPPRSDVTYEVELLEVEPEPEIDTLPLAERKRLGNKKRERGNWWYGRNENSLAIQCYRRALDFLEEVETGRSDEVTDAVLQGLLEDRASVCNNMAAAQIKLELYDAALTSLQTVLRSQPNNVKALFRKAKVHKAKNDPPAALKCLRRAAELEPSNLDVAREMALVTKVIQKQKVTEKELAKRMFGGEAVKAEKANVKKPSVLVWTAVVAASLAIGLTGMAAYRLKYM